MSTNQQHEGSIYTEEKNFELVVMKSAYLKQKIMEIEQLIPGIAQLKVQ